MAYGRAHFITHMYTHTHARTHTHFTADFTKGVAVGMEIKTNEAERQEIGKQHVWQQEAIGTMTCCRFSRGRFDGYLYLSRGDLNF